MRNDSVNQFQSRTEAVFMSLLKVFRDMQANASRELQSALKNLSISLILFAEKARVELNRAPLGPAFLAKLQRLAKSVARSHGFYLSGLTALEELLAPEAEANSRIMVLWLSDGAPSDHVFERCSHDIEVWQRLDDSDKADCVKGAACRTEVKTNVREQILRRVQRLGDTLGQNRLSFYTVGFGPVDSEFEMLHDMAAVLMHGQCLSLGLNVAALVNAFSTLTDTSSTLLLGTAGTCQEQVRNEKECLDEVVETRTWHLYTSRKYTFSKKQRFRSQQLAPGADGIAVSKTHFSSGRERYAFDCTEVACEVKGFRLVAKKSRAEKKLRFHERIAKTQSAAQAMADCFNKRLQSCFDSPQPALLLHFVPCAIYEVDEVSRSGGRAWFLVEPLLEGRFCKWNNNAGGVRKNIGVTVRIGTSELCIDDVTQAFSHFSYERSNHSALICDMQGIWNAVDGFSLTDPVIHHVGCNRKHRADTDFGGAGIDSFLATHKCSTLCQMLKLPFIEPRLSKHKQHTFESVLRRHQAY